MEQSEKEKDERKTYVRRGRKEKEPKRGTRDSPRPTSLLKGISEGYKRKVGWLKQTRGERQEEKERGKQT